MWEFLAFPISLDRNRETVDGHKRTIQEGSSSIRIHIPIYALSTVSTSDAMHTEPFTSVGKTPYLLAQVYIAMKSM